MIDVGSGPPIVLIPGIQGRWEWMRPAIAALATEWRVISGSLPGEPGEVEQGTGGFEEFVSHVDRLMDAANVSRAAICGVSFGGLVALRYAAVRRERVRALVLVSTPGPSWKPSPRQSKYLRWPLLSSPLFAAAATGRVWRELRATLPDARERLGFCAAWIRLLLEAPGVPSRMGFRGNLAVEEEFTDDCAHIAVPTLVVAGERHLDQVVNFDDTMTYVRMIPGAEFQLFERTGHLGTATAPQRFASIVSTFLKKIPA